ncbi:MAG: glycosyltransferase family 4 protein [Methanosarcinales archaeon]|nr:MAG: glycosyltransferase family 4 protein [Methanosarcinales archaeon]
MKIAQVCPRYHPDVGGVETHVREISERLVQKRFDVEVITTDPSGKLHDEVINRVNVTRFKSIAPNDAFFFAPGIYGYLKDRDYDIIHAHNYHAFPALFAAFAKKDRNFVFTSHYHGLGHTFIRNLLLKPYRPLGAKIFKKADKVICVSQFELNLIKDHFNVPASKLINIPNGINLDEFRDIKPLEREHKTILFVGRLEKYKGVQHIIQALPLLAEYRFEIVGTGPCEQELKQLAGNLGISERINWIKELSRVELLQHYKSADVFVILSGHEAYGIVVAEALASGTPCIVADTGALSEFVDDKMCFGIALPVEANELAEMIERAASVKQAKYDRNLMGWDEVVERLIDVYERI